MNGEGKRRERTKPRLLDGLMPETEVTTREEQTGSHSLDVEAKKLLDFKKQHIKKNDLTSCPQCATLVNINANKCPQCTSEISEHTKHVREQLDRLTQVTAQLHELHNREIEVSRQEAGSKPFWERVRDFFTEPQFLQDLKIVLPFLIGFLVLVVFLGSRVNGVFFWLISLTGGFVVYYLFKAWNVKKYVTVDLYCTLLVCGLLFVLSSSLGSSMNFWPDLSFLTATTVEVQSSVVNIREAGTMSSSIISTAQRGEKLKVIDLIGSWYNVETESGTTGWVHVSLVK